jgi:hypothetical protein
MDCRGSPPPTVHKREYHKCETTFERLPLRGIPMYTLRIHVIHTHVLQPLAPTCGFKYIVQYSTACLTVWLCRICLRHRTVIENGEYLQDWLSLLFTQLFSVFFPVWGTFCWSENWVVTFRSSLYHLPQRPGRPPLAPPLGAPRGAAPLPAICWPPLSMWPPRPPRGCISIWAIQLFQGLNKYYLLWNSPY